jgi:hypothetical protein
MIRDFKFLTDNDRNELEFGGFVHDLHDGFASWMWTRQENINRDPNWLVDQMGVLSIRTFLSMFPEHMIVPILSITGNEITMTIDNVNNEWPFSLNGETPLYITFLRWVPEI